MYLIKKYYISLIWWLIMCYLLFSPSSGLPKGDFINFPHKDKIVHWGMFGIMTLIYLYETEKSEHKMLRATGIVILFGVIFGSLSEYIQYAFVAERKGNIFDFIADVSGTLMAIVSYFLILRKLVLRKLNLN